jgi:Aldehyde dehydrogenase family
VLPVIPALDEDDAIRIANDTIYGLNASVFTSDVNRARQVGARLRSGTVGHNAMRTDFGVSFGGYKQSGIGREGLHEGLQYFLETKFMVLKASRRATRTPACRSLPPVPGGATRRSVAPSGYVCIVSLVRFPGDACGIGAGHDAPGGAPGGPGGRDPVQEPALGLGLSPPLGGVVRARAAGSRRRGIDVHDGQGRPAAALA